MKTIWCSVLLVTVVSVAGGLGFAQVVLAPALLIAAFVAMALLGLLFSRARTERRWQAAVDAYADREIAKSRRLPTIK